MSSPQKSAKKAKAESEFDRAESAASFIFCKTNLRPQIALVLGSGLGAFADEFRTPAKIPYTEIPHFPRSTAIGHAGQLVVGKVGEIPVVGMQGLVHLYEGYSAKDVAFPIRVFARMGTQVVILTNAAGGIKPEFVEGQLVVIKDHINLQGVSPLSGPNDETPAEIRYLRSIGADLVGMSTVPEVIAARHSGMRVLGISCVTNAAAGILDQPLDHKEVLEIAERVQGQFIALLKTVIPRIAAELDDRRDVFGGPQRDRT